MSGWIPTFKQYVRDHRKDLSSRYGVPLAEVTALYPDRYFRSVWWREAVSLFEAGQNFSPQHWWSLTDDQRYSIARTSRALKGDPLPWRKEARA